MLTILPAAGISYRTKCLPADQAARFARCIEANPLFTNVSLCTSTRAKGERCHFVTFRPVNEERREDMAARLQITREERAMSEGSAYVWAFDKDGGRPFFWLMSASGEVYEVDPRGHCSCPDFGVRCEANGLQCKHLHALKAGLGTLQNGLQRIPADAAPELDARCDAQANADREALDADLSPCDECDGFYAGDQCHCAYRDYAPGEEEPITKPEDD